MGGSWMGLEKKKAFIIRVAYYGMIVAIALVAGTYLLRPLLPFILGFVFSWILHRPAMALARRTHLGERISSAALAVVLYAVLFAGALTAGVQVISALEHFVPQIPVIYARRIVPFITENMGKLEIYLQDVDPAIVDVVDRLMREMVTNLEKLISSFSVLAVRLVSGIITGLPNVILSVILTVISTVFISLDYDHIMSFLRGLLPSGIRDTVLQTVTTGVDSIRKILGAYILILLMSFVELSTGLLLLNIPYAVGVALLIAVIDIMPVLGTGLVLIPWAIVAAILGNLRMALGIALLYIIMLVVRNIVEPKLVGQQMGLHPLATLIAMFVGLQLFGLAGLFGFPIALSLWLKLAKSSKAAKAGTQA